MAYERNRFRSVGAGSHILGSVIEYNTQPGGGREPGWRLPVLVVLALAVLGSLVYAKFVSGDNDPVVRSGAAAVSVVPSAGAASGVERAAPPVSAVPSGAKTPETPAVKQAREWAVNADMRPARERMLLERLADSERLGRLAIAVDTIEQLRMRPAMADLDDKLARRLGELNVKRLMSGEATPWVAETTVRRGQTVHRIAREHGTTVAAVRTLNKLRAGEEPEAGRKLRVLEFPRAALVIHKSTRHADLTLNGKLFKRYYFSVGDRTIAGSYPITSRADEGPRSRFAALGIKATPQDVKELDMFLAPGSSLVVSEM